MKIKEAVAVIALLTAAALVSTWPLCAHFSRAIPAGNEPAAVSYFQLFSARWTGVCARSPAQYWHAPFFHPFPGAFAWCEPDLFSCALVSLSSKAVGAIAAYNAVVIAYMVLMGMAGYAGARLLTQDRTAAFFAALWLCAGSFALQQISSMPLLASGFAFFFIVSLFAFCRSPRGVWFLSAIVCYILAWFTCKQTAFYLTLLAPFFVWPWIRLSNAAKCLALSCAGLVFAALAVLPMAFIQLKLTEMMGFSRGLEGVRAVLGLPSLVTPAKGNWLASLAGPRVYSWDIGVVCLLVTVTASLTGGVIGYLRNDRMSRQVCLGLFTAAVVAVLLGLGPLFAPYRFLFRHVPGLEFIRAPARIVMFAVFALAVLAAFSLSRLRARFPGVKAKALTMLAFGGLFAEMWTAPIPLSWPLAETDGHSAVISWLSRSALPGQPVMELPVYKDNRDMDASAMLRMLVHGHPVMNGYESFAPNAYVELKQALREDLPGRGIRFLRAYGARYVLLHRDTPVAGERVELSQLGAPVFDDGSHAVYLLPPGEEEKLTIVPRASFGARPVKGKMYAIGLLRPVASARLLDFHGGKAFDVSWPGGNGTLLLYGSALIDEGENEIAFRLTRPPEGNAAGRGVLIHHIQDPHP